MSICENENELAHTGRQTLIIRSIAHVDVHPASLRYCPFSTNSILTLLFVLPFRYPPLSHLR